jgi:hypothetical protein
MRPTGTDSESLGYASRVKGALGARLTRRTREDRQRMGGEPNTKREPSAKGARTPLAGC